jgi:CheY-like chemotaxis protein
MARRRRVLIVEDDLDSVRLLALRLGKMGHEVDYAINATAAIDTARSFLPDIIFLDLLLPDDHGSRVCSQLRKCPELANTRIIAVTASTHMIDLQRAMDAGCDDVLRKPVSTAIYERLIAGGINRRKLRELLSEQENKTLSSS